MAIHIKGIEMPKDKAFAVVIHPDGTAYTAEMFAGVCTKYLADCTAVPVPPHGRLIDADALVDSFDPSDFWNPNAEDNCFAAIHVVNCAPTIIPAEEAAE